MKVARSTPGNRGVVLEVVLLGTMVVLILVVSLLDIGMMRIRASGTRYRQAQAFYCAEAGLARAGFDLSRESTLDWTAAEQRLGDGFYRVRSEPRGDGAVMVRSTGEFRRPNGERITVHLEAVLERPSDGAPYSMVSWQQLPD